MGDAVSDVVSAGERKYRIDLEPSGKRWEWTVWAWGGYYDSADADAWRAPWVALSEFDPDLFDSTSRRSDGKAKTLYGAELAARRYIAMVEASISSHRRHAEKTIRIEVQA